MLAVDYFCGKTPSPMFDRVVNNVSGINICNYKDVFINICDGVFFGEDSHRLLPTIYRETFQHKSLKGSSAYHHIAVKVND